MLKINNRLTTDQADGVLLHHKGIIKIFILAIARKMMYNNGRESNMINTFDFAAEFKQYYMDKKEKLEKQQMSMQTNFAFC